MKYLRPHRTNGSKVLRCFPHCCPEHTESPFCASSLGVDVGGSVKFLQQAIVLLHFEASYEPAIDCGDLLDAHHIESSLRTDSNPRGEWIPTDAVAIHDDHVEFEYNVDAEKGWNYRWLGGSSTQQRRCWHCIKAYVLVQVEGPERSRKFQVVAIAQSPPFVVMSYRRACKSCQKKSRADPVLSTTSREACECEGIYRLGDTHLDEIISTGATHVAILPHWQASASSRNKPTTEDMERHLGLLYGVLTSTPAAIALDSALFQQTLGLLCDDGKATPNQPTSQTDTPTTSVLLALLRGRAASDLFLRRHAAVILDQHDLFRLYERWLGQLYDIVDAAVRPTHDTAAVYFESLAAISTASTTSSPTGFEAFVAQLREVYLVRSELALYSTIWSEFVLDGKPRVLRVFPNGESTMSNAGGLMYGDYMGFTIDANRTLCVDVVCWPVQGGTASCYVIRLVLRRSLPHFLQISATVQVTHNVTDQITWNMTAAERMDVLRRYTLATVLVVEVGYQRVVDSEEGNVWV
ncbi:hypothetical protein DYB34_008615 [Aphanomyces astaci]|uniref:Uncharacterized protein n=1 Tax=Aphanomyces astaci TaxID=112090 RepID=A0A418C9Q9_APHAT|nr:hypothetical protein DYB34_008615 [Aphanomyces astaci]